MINLRDIARERILELLAYDPDSGEFRWRLSRGPRAAGSIAGSVNSDGYRVIRIDGRDEYAHRIAWFIVHGVWPSLVDHRDHDPTHNAITNLRVATKSKNAANRGPQINNTSGFKGVRWHKQRGKWTAQLQHHGRNTYLGLYESREEAAKAYAEAATAAFGEFARIV